MTILWSRPARDSLYRHIEYLLERDPASARRVKTALLDGIGLLEASPFLGRQGRWENTRELIIDKYPYIVAYRLTTNFIEILYIHHTRQSWPS